MNPDSFSKKLYIARNAEGEPNSRELAVMRRLEQEFSVDPCFVCIVPYGSVVDGYSTQQSDIDACALFDYPEEKLGPLVGVGGKLTENLQRVAEKVEKEEKAKLHLVSCNINPELIRKLKEAEIHSFQESYNLTLIGECLSLLTRVTTGDKVAHYRQVFSVWLNGLSKETQRVIKDQIIHALLHKDDLSIHKRSARLKDLSQDENLNILDEREKMWRKRVARVWGV